MRLAFAYFLLVLPTAAQTPVPQSVQDKLRETLSVKDFGAKGDDSTDDTAAIQACIDYAATNRASCFVPPGIYKITGPGLHMLTGQPSLYGLQSMGNGSASLKYYGTGTALTIGDGRHRLFAINLSNIGVAAADGISAQYGINTQNVSGGEWTGITVGGGGTSGTFSSAIRFSDAGGINIYRLIVSNQSYTPGTTGILFDKFESFGNANITIQTSDQSNMEKMFDMRNLFTGFFNDIYVENSATGVYIDNTAYEATVQNVVFDGGEFNTSGTGPSSYRILSVIGAARKVLELDQLRFTNMRFYLSGGVANPFVFNIDRAASTASRIWLHLDNNVMIGANMSVVHSNSTMVNVDFGPNLVRDNTGTIRPPDLSGAGTVQEIAPQDAKGRPLVQRDQNGAIYMNASTGDTMARPDPGAYTAGAINGTSINGLGNGDGFLRIQAGGGGKAASNAGCDFSGHSAIADMNSNIVCGINGSERLRMDLNGIRLNGPTTIANGTLSAPSGVSIGPGGSAIRKYSTISANLNFSAPATVPGCTSRIALAPVGFVTNSAPIFYSPPVAVPAAMVYSAWTEPNGTIVAQWCQFSGTPTDPDGPGATYTVSVAQ
jgi:hypothetical protein